MLPRNSGVADAVHLSRRNSFSIQGGLCEGPPQSGPAARWPQRKPGPQLPQGEQVVWVDRRFASRARRAGRPAGPSCLIEPLDADMFGSVPNEQIQANALAILGVAGSGKSTLAGELVRSVDETCCLISGGEYLRTLAAGGDEDAGLLVKSGGAMSPEQFRGFVSTEVRRLPTLPELIVLDGNPRSLGQAKVIPKLGFQSFRCIIVHVPAEIALSRIEARARMAPRPDDDPGVAYRRVSREIDELFEIAKLLSDQGTVFVVDGTLEVDGIVAKALDHLKPE